MSKADANIKIGADGSAFTAAVKDIQKNTDTLANSIAAKLSRLGGALSTVGMVGGAIGSAVSALGDMAKAVIDPAAAAERLSLSFEVMLGSESEALDFMKQLQDYAAKTPFEMQGISEAAKTLLAMTSLSGEEAVGVIEQLGNIAAATGGNLNDLATIYAKAFNSGVTNEVAESFERAGLPVRNLIADLQGVSFDEVKKQISDAEIGFSGLTGALAVYTGEGGKLHGMTERLSETFEGLASTLGDNVTLSLQKVGEQLLPHTKQVVEKLIEALDAAQPSIAVLADMLGNWLGQNVGGNLLPVLDELVLRVPELGWHLKNMAEDVGEWFESIVSAPREATKALASFVGWVAPASKALSLLIDGNASAATDELVDKFFDSLNGDPAEQQRKQSERQAELAAIKERTAAMYREAEARVAARRQEAEQRDAARAAERAASEEKQAAIREEERLKMEADRRERQARKQAIKDEEKRNKLREERRAAAEQYVAGREAELGTTAARALQLMGRTEEAQKLRNDIEQEKRIADYKKRGATDDEAGLRAGLDRMLDEFEQQQAETQQAASRQWIHTGVSAIGGGGSVVRFGGQDATLKESQKHTEQLRDVLDILRSISRKDSALRSIPVTA